MLDWPYPACVTDPWIYFDCHQPQKKTNIYKEDHHSAYILSYNDIGALYNNNLVSLYQLSSVYTYTTVSYL